ncbi:hypothetical protein SUGI_0119030 [Cryptomeria japonica]|uniref:rust resistance kinase Lr10 n=1 Tax=Cryptomeria japonica TaxID=3369 RepID=UPI002408D93D|nr:rust resistance kinase Lr10 [Cryptomeria japonica]GLJ09953.1 hypothetical protein SUGI_0119030 [Cryptomeria japonica]
MEALHLVLPFLQPKALRSPCFILLTAISLSWLASHCNGKTPSEACQVFGCGKYSFDYPFGRKGSGCGDPKLQLECDNTVKMPLIKIGVYEYYILKPLNYSQLAPYSYPTMIILYKQLQQNVCALSEHIYDQFWNSSSFPIGKGYKNITLGTECNSSYSKSGNLQCNGQRYYNLSLPDLKKDCKSEFKLPVKEIDLEKPLPIILDGINITWKRNEYCKDCESYYKNCAHLDTSSFCYCLSTSYSQKCSSSGDSKTAAIVGAAIGSGVLIAAIISLVAFRRKRPLAFRELELRKSMESSPTKVEQFLDDYAQQMPSRYSYSQLRNITNNFADKLGQGGFAVVYKGKLPRGNLVAVKILDRSRHSEAQFMNEVATIGRIHHVNLVRLMGFCFDGFRSALVYEYMVNGSLDNYIFPEKKSHGSLNEEQLYSIALGAARGIAYLHHDCERRIIHFDIKPHNILLDKDFTPKIADFGLAKLCGREDDHISMTNAGGTPGYAAPEVWNTNLGPVTDKSDVYSFGMVLLEIAGGRRNIDLRVSRSSQLYLPDWAFKLAENGQLERRFRGRGEAEIECKENEKAIRMAKVALWCIQYNSADRPSISRVVQMLEENGDDVSNPPLPYNSYPESQSSLPFSAEEFSSTV